MTAREKKHQISKILERHSILTLILSSINNTNIPQAMILEYWLNPAMSKFGVFAYLMNM